jgi:hypothetical protein
VGMDAFVRCRCWEDRKTKPCPYPSLTRLSAEDNRLELDLPWEGNETEHSKFDAWIENACEHERMRLAWERISNWSGYRLFQTALQSSGDYFAFLLQALPNSNGGLTSSIDAKRCLVFLEEFANQAEFGKQVILVNAASNERLFEYIERYQGIFLMSGSHGYDGGVDPQGFFLRSRVAPNLELFRSMRFEQKRLADEVFELRALDGAGTYKLHSAIGGKTIESVVHYPEHLAVVSQSDHPKNYDYIVTPLRTVFNASVATGNPVSWC